MTRGRGGRPSAPWLVAAAGLGFLAGIGVMTASSRLTAARTALVAGNWTGNAPDARAQVEVRPAPLDSPRPVSPAPAPSGPPIVAADPIEELRKRDLRLPVKGLERDDVRDTFNEMRGGVRRHEALDILAPRDTPVLAVDDGTIAKLFLSKPGGITIYQFDPTATYTYYYAHLSRYAEGLEEHEAVKRGQVIGYVGTTGNAPPETPHLHFAIFKLTDEKRWWQGTAIDPYPVLR